MEELLKAIGNPKKVDEALTTYIKTHAPGEVIEALKTSDLLSWTSLFDECPSYKYGDYYIYTPGDTVNVIKDFQGYNIISVEGAFGSDYSDYGIDSSLVLHVHGLRTDEHFMDTIHKIRSV